MKELGLFYKNKPLMLVTGVFIAVFVCFIAFYNRHEGLSFFSAGLCIGLASVIYLLIKRSENISATNDDIFSSQHQQLLDSLEIFGDGFLLFDKDQKLVIANDKIKELYKGMNIPFDKGMDRIEITKAAYDWFQDDNQKAKINDRMQARIKKRLTPRTGARWSLPDGKDIVINEKYTHDGGIVSIIRDISDQVQKRQQQEEQTHFLKLVMENVPIGICVYDTDNRIRTWNEKYIEIMDIDEKKISVGIHMKELLIANFSSFDVEEQDSEKFANSVIENLEWSLYTKTERQLISGKHVEIMRTSLPDGGHIATFTDVTTTKSAQLMLQESEKRYRRMVELSPDAILVQKDGMIIFANAAAITLLGIRNLHDLIGAHVRKFFLTADREKLQDHFGGCDHMTAGEKFSSVKSQIIQNSGARVDVEVEATTLLYGDKPVIQLIARDISAQIKTQGLLKKAKDDAEYASKLKGTFLANMSHELRTPLNAIIGFSEIIKNQIFGAVGSPKYLEYADDIHNSGKHLLDLINDILDYSKMESMQQSLSEDTIDMEKLVGECVRLVEPQRETSGVLINISVAPNLPTVLADPKILKQVVLNLLSNSIKFTPKKGDIAVVLSMAHSGTFELSVKDSGIGIKNEDLSKALTPFVQIDNIMSRKHQGTGLGLPLSKDMMELHGGDLILTSVYGEGTNVIISLPENRVQRSAA